LTLSEVATDKSHSPWVLGTQRQTFCYTRDPKYF